MPLRNSIRSKRFTATGERRQHHPHIRPQHTWRQTKHGATSLTAPRSRAGRLASPPSSYSRRQSRCSRS